MVENIKLKIACSEIDIFLCKNILFIHTFHNFIPKMKPSVDFHGAEYYLRGEYLKHIYVHIFKGF